MMDNRVGGNLREVASIFVSESSGGTHLLSYYDQSYIHPWRGRDMFSGCMGAYENVACTMQMHGTTAPPAIEANSRPAFDPSTLSPVVHADHWILTTVNMPEDTEDPTAPGATAPADTLRCVEDRCDVLLYS